MDSTVLRLKKEIVSVKIMILTGKREEEREEG
jgi:hypothetical protein